MEQLQQTASAQSSMIGGIAGGLGGLAGGFRNRQSWWWGKQFW